jgi:hypothetical protein
MSDDAHFNTIHELIQNLLLEAGRLMEFQSADLGLILPQAPSLVGERVAQLRQTASDILALADAAQALVRSLSTASATI